MWLSLDPPPPAEITGASDRADKALPRIFAAVRTSSNHDQFRTIPLKFEQSGRRLHIGYTSYRAVCRSPHRFQIIVTVVPPLGCDAVNAPAVHGFRDRTVVS